MALGAGVFSLLEGVGVGSFGTGVVPFGAPAMDTFGASTMDIFGFEAGGGGVFFLASDLGSSFG